MGALLRERPGRRHPRRGGRRQRPRGRRLALGDRSARRHHQLRARLPALLRLDRRRARGRAVRWASCTTRCSTSCYHARRAAAAPSATASAIRVSREDASSTARCSRPASPTTCASNDDNLDHFARRSLKRARELRRDGSAALDLCYVACGRLDGFWELKLKPWDVAAGGLIVERPAGASPIATAAARGGAATRSWPPTAPSTTTLLDVLARAGRG